MADDVASFFKSKKSKKHGSGQRGLSANVQNPDALVRRLERTVQQQQMFDRENGVEENEEELEQPRPPLTQQLSGSGGGTGGGGGEQNNEESDWLDIQEQPEIDLAKLGIKEMEIREESDDEAVEDEESLGNRKTWNIPGQQQDKQQDKPKKLTFGGMDVDDGEEVASTDDKATPATNIEEEKKKEEEETEAPKAEADKATVAKKYVAPSIRNKQLTGASRPMSSAKEPNIEDSMEFPSLAAAGELEAEIEKTKKKKPPSHVSKKAASPAPAHAPSPAPAEETQTSRPPGPTPQSVPEAKSAGQPASYVPPHLRKRGGAS